MVPTVGGETLFINTVLIPFVKFGPPYPVRIQQPQEQRYPDLRVHAGEDCFTMYLGELCCSSSDAVAVAAAATATSSSSSSTLNNCD